MTHHSQHYWNARKVAMISGASGAIGMAIARQMAKHQQSDIVLLCRDEEKAKAAQHQVIQQTGNNNVVYEIVDLSDYTSVKVLRERWNRPLHVLINNAAITPKRRQQTTQGIELQFATNVLGYFWMIREFEDVLVQSAPSRVINVASYWAGGLDIHDLEFKTRVYDNDLAYRQSKQANRMLSTVFAKKLKPYGVSVNACHPGDVHSNLSHALGFGGHETPDQAAKTPVWLATSPDGEKLSGQYFEHTRQSRCQFSEDESACDALFDACSKYTI